MPERYCFAPPNPDIAGIGVRWAIYIQAAITTAQALVCRSKHSHPSTSLKNIFIAQYVFLAASLLYLIAEPTPLSSFHRFLAATLAWIGYNSSVVARFILGNLTDLSRFWLVLEVDAVFFVIGFTALTPASECITHPAAIEVHEGAFAWLVFAYIVPISATICMAVLGSVFGSCAISLPRVCSLIGILSQTYTIFSVEKALRVSPVDPGQENIWTYGQMIPLVLLCIPLSSLVRDYLGMGVIEFVSICFRSSTHDVDIEAATEE